MTADKYHRYLVSYWIKDHSSPKNAEVPLLGEIDNIDVVRSIERVIGYDENEDADHITIISYSLLSPPTGTDD